MIDGTNANGDSANGIGGDLQLLHAPRVIVILSPDICATRHKRVNKKNEKPITECEIITISLIYGDREHVYTYTRIHIYIRYVFLYCFTLEI